MKRFLTITLTFMMAAAMAGAGMRCHAQKSRDRALTVMSFNVRQWTRDTDPDQPTYWKTRMAAMERMILDINPDVICFQEFMAPVGIYIPEAYRRVGLTVSHPIYVRKGIKTSKHGASIFWDACTIDGFGIQIINVHSRWESEILERTVRQVNSRLTGRDLSCGDWNNGLATIVKAGLEMESVRTMLSVPENDTFANFKRPAESHGAIDHFFVKGVTPVSYMMITDGYGCEKMSDHFPIVMVAE